MSIAFIIVLTSVERLAPNMGLEDIPLKAALPAGAAAVLSLRTAASRIFV